MALTSIRTDGDEIQIVDQQLLPHTEQWIRIDSTDDAYEAIKSMNIRGAPAIASLASLSIASHLSCALKADPSPPYLESLDALQAHLDRIFTHLLSSRPTAVNLGQAIDRLRTVLRQGAEAGSTIRVVAELLVKEGRQIADEDVGRNREMSRHGAQWIIAQVEKRSPGASANGLNVMTVCNTGSLATSVCNHFFFPFSISISFPPFLFLFLYLTRLGLEQGYGTALGVITHLHEIGKLKRAFYTQSTPYHQGSRFVQPGSDLLRSTTGFLLIVHLDWSG